MHSLTISGKVGSVQPLKKVGDTSVLNFSLASTEYRGKDNKQTIWFSCSLWGTHAENVHSWVTVGKGLVVFGNLVADENGNPKTYESKNGEVRASFAVTVEKLEFTSPKEDLARDSNPIDEDEDDLPF
jgi:single-stranded DNA-binding protein